MTFEEIQHKAIADWEDSENGKEPRIYVSTASCSHASGSLVVLDHLITELEHRRLDTEVIEVGCIGCCHLEPLVYIAKGKRPRICYSQVTPEIATQLVTDYVINDNPRPDLALCIMDKGEIADIPNLDELPMFKPQERIVFHNCGYINPRNINSYIVSNGYSGLAKALQMTPREVIELISRSGLRGRGGAGFSTGTKWRNCHEINGIDKYLICNAHEGDPRTYTGRTLLEGDPHSVLEGMLIGAYATGATRGYIYVCTENILAIDRLKTALKQADDYGLSGDNILNSSFSCHIEIREGPSDFVCGEETAMIRALEGKRGMPYPRPPFPSESGLKGKPTAINNIETLANVTAILQKGVEKYTSYGTEKSKGTKTFTLTGNVARSGLIEVPMGTTLHQIVYDIGGGISNGNDLKAVVVGGPSGGCFPASALETPVNYENFNEAGAIMGSGSILVADSNNCMVDLVKRLVSFIQAESCGECVIGREGTVQMLEMLTDIARGKGKLEYIDLLLELGEGMKLGSLCGLGKTAPNPVLTSIKHFREEYEAHIVNKQCPMGIC